jgi:hypothetical protein
MVGLLGVKDVWSASRTASCTRRSSRIGQTVVDVAERVVYAVVKQS